MGTVDYKLLSAPVFNIEWGFTVKDESSVTKNSVDMLWMRSAPFCVVGNSWDLQRIREQRQYEKLRARYEGEDRSQDRCSPSTATATSSASRSIGETVVQSLWPQPEDASHLQVEPWLPVTAFGAPLVNVVQTSVDPQLFLFFLFEFILKNIAVI